MILRQRSEELALTFGAGVAQLCETRALGGLLAGYGWTTVSDSMEDINLTQITQIEEQNGGFGEGAGATQRTSRQRVDEHITALTLKLCGNQRGEEHHCRENFVFRNSGTIGRQADEMTHTEERLNLPAAYMHVSRVECQVEPDTGGGWQIRGGARCSTQVNDDEIGEREVRMLKKGDRISFGHRSMSTRIIKYEVIGMSKLTPQARTYAGNLLTALRRATKALNKAMNEENEEHILDTGSRLAGDLKATHNTFKHRRRTDTRKETRQGQQHGRRVQHAVKQNAKQQQRYNKKRRR